MPILHMIKITGTTILKVYLYLISLITLTAALFSGAIVIKAATSYFTPLQFSYELYQANSEDDIKQAEKDGYVLESCYDGEVTNIEGNDMCWDENQRKEDLINGGAVFLSMMILFALHQFGIKKTEKIKTPELIIKSYTLLSLLVYSITGIVMIPVAIYELVNYFLATDMAELSYAPAYPIALVALVLPLWYVFFNKTLNLKDE